MPRPVHAATDGRLMAIPKVGGLTIGTNVAQRDSLRPPELDTIVHAPAPDSLRGGRERSQAVTRTMRFTPRGADKDDDDLANHTIAILWIRPRAEEE